METILYKINNWDGSSGIMYGPFTPIYGIGAILIILISKYIFKKVKFNKFIDTILIFIMTTLILSIIEFIGGILIEKLFGIIFWDYSGNKYSLGKYVCLEMSLLWGLMSIIFIYIIKPILDLFVKKIPNIVTIIFIIYFIIDLTITIMSI